MNVQDEIGVTALMMASVSGHLEVVRELLNHDGVDVFVKCTNCYTALDMARMAERAEIARLLEEHIQLKEQTMKARLDATTKVK